MDAMDSKHIKGLRVVGLADGANLGTIEQIYLDPATKRVVGFGLTADTGGPDPEFSAIVDATDVYALGADALTLTDSDAVRGSVTGSQLDALVEIDELTKRQVMTQGGALLGNVAAVELDPSSLMLARIEVSPGFFKSNRWIPADQITRLGGDVVVVAAVVVAAADEAAMLPTAAPAGMNGA